MIIIATNKTSFHVTMDQIAQTVLMFVMERTIVETTRMKTKIIVQPDPAPRLSFLVIRVAAYQIQRNVTLILTVRIKQTKKNVVSTIM